MIETQQLETVRDEVRRLASGRRALRFRQVLGQALFWLLVGVAALAFFVQWKAVLLAVAAAIVLAVVVASLAASWIPVDSVAVAA